MSVLSPQWDEVSFDHTYQDEDIEYRTFYAGKGETVRVAIAWWAVADGDEGTWPIGASELHSDLSLLVERMLPGQDPDRILIDYSNSWDNSYEFVAFIAPASGYYLVTAHRNAGEFSDYGNRMGIAIARVSHHVFLPILSNDSD